MKNSMILAAIVMLTLGAIVGQSMLGVLPLDMGLLA
jgi:hypothetical protein